MARPPDKSLAFLDGLRGLAALWVLLHHARWLLWEGWETFARTEHAHSAVERALAFALVPLRYGHEAVLFFFVLSGFVIHLGYARRLAAQGQSARFDWPQYFFRRARRLYPPLIFAMLLTLALDSAGAARGWAIYEGRTPSPLMNAQIGHDLSAGAALGNLAFLMQSWVPCWGSDGPLWSLHFEWWFYMLYPALWLVSRRSVRAAALLVAVLFAGSFFVPADAHSAFFAAQIFSALLTWWIGALLADIHAGRLRLRWEVLAPLALLVPALPVVLPLLGARWPALAHGWLADTFYAIGFAGIFSCCFALRDRGWALHFLARLKPLGDMSYTLYIIHLPVLVFLSGWVASRSPGGALPAHFGWAAAGALVCLLLAWLAHFVVERPFTTRKKGGAA